MKSNKFADDFEGLCHWIVPDVPTQETQVSEDKIKVGMMAWNSPKGRELRDFLKRELQLPDRLRSFTVAFDVDEVVKVTCVYYPAERLK